jgi:hypothetical protein
LKRPSQTERRAADPTARPASGRTTAVRPGDRRDGQPLIFDWGRHLTRAQKQKYREGFVIACGAFIFFVIALVLGFGALQQYFFKPRFAVATVNGQAIERRWYQKNVDYQRLVLRREFLDAQNQLQNVQVNVQANAAATATAQASSQPAAAGPTPAATATAAASPATTGTPTPTLTPEPTFNPEQSATAAVLQRQMARDQSQFATVDQQVIEDLIDAQLMRQQAAKFGINVSKNDVAAQVQKTTASVGGEALVQQLFKEAQLSQGDFEQIQYNVILKQKFESYFAEHADQAPAPTPTPAPTATATAAPVVGPQAPTPTLQPTPAPSMVPGADTLDRWLQEGRKTASIKRASFPLPD